MITKISTYRLFETLIYTENKLNEGLILTHDIYNSINAIEGFFKFDQLNIIYPDKSKINLTVNNFNIETFTKFLILINNLGYYVALITIYNNKNMSKRIKLSEFKSEYYTDEFISKLTKIDFILEPKFDITHKLKSNILYHVTEEKYLDSILKNGLIAKSENTKTEYPERIYLVYTLIDARNYIENKNNYYLTNPDKDYTTKDIERHNFRMRKYKILQITIDNSDDLIFYEDPNFKGKGLYTYNNISPEKISIND